MEPLAHLIWNTSSRDAVESALDDSEICTSYLNVKGEIVAISFCHSVLHIELQFVVLALTYTNVKPGIYLLPVVKSKATLYAID